MAGFKKSFNRDKNYIPPQGASSFGEKWPEGEYFTVGIKWAFKDVDKQPALKIQKNGVMSARMRFVVKGEEKKVGPYYMADLASMNLLLRAFNKEASLMPIPDEKNANAVRKFLVYCAENINNSGNEVKFKVNEDGFIAWVDGTHIEANCGFIMRVIKLTTKNQYGIPAWRIQDFGEGRSAKLIDVVLEIITGEMGTETPYKGAQFITTVPYGFKYYENDDTIGFEVSDTGEDTSRAYALRKFMTVYCPKLLTEGAETSYPTDVNNIVPWMNQWREEVIFQTEVRNNPGKNGGMFYNVNWGKLSVVSGTPMEANLNVKPLELKKEELDIPDEMKPKPKQEETITDNIDIDTKAQQYLHEALNILAEDLIRRDIENKLYDEERAPKAEVFGDSGLSEAGIMVRDAYLIPLKEENKIPPTKLTQVNFDEGCTILDALAGKADNDELKIKIAYKLDKLNEALLGMDEKVEEAFEFSDDDEWA